MCIPQPFHVLGFMSYMEKNLFEKFWHGLVPRFAREVISLFLRACPHSEVWKLSSVSREALRCVAMCIGMFCILICRLFRNCKGLSGRTISDDLFGDSLCSSCAFLWSVLLRLKHNNKHPVVE